MRPFGSRACHVEGEADKPRRTQSSSNAVQYLGIAFHELATNSAKYGVLGGNAGKISVVWDVTGSDTARLFSLGWTETDGSRVQTIGKGGFGTVVLKRVAPEAVGGRLIFNTMRTG
jgi:two-component sensor histidine kinase